MRRFHREKGLMSEFSFPSLNTNRFIKSEIAESFYGFRINRFGNLRFDKTSFLCLFFSVSLPARRSYGLQGRRLGASVVKKNSGNGASKKGEN